MYLLMYEISGKKDRHGLRMRLVYVLRKLNAIQLMRSSWLISTIKPELQSILEECIYHGFPVVVTNWDPIFLPDYVRTNAPSLTDLLLGVVLHSPEVTELGITAKFLNTLDDAGFRYHAILGGVMGRLAILDAKLETKVFINHPYKPSDAIDYLIKRNVDLIILLNQAINKESGITFGLQVVENSSLLPFFKLPIIQLDRIHTKDAFLINWTIDHPQFQIWLEHHFQVTPISPPPPKETLRKNGDFITRILRAVQRDDKILINGVVIGEVNADMVEITTKSNRFYELRGGRLIEHGIQKLGLVDLTTARITTLKSLRRVPPSSIRILKSSKKKGNIAMLTWRGEQVYYHADKIDCLVSIGDDTTFVSTDILSRFSKPIIGIIDGDSEGILYYNLTLEQLAELAPPNSLFLQVRPETDDKVGRLIQRDIFKKQVKIRYSNLTLLKQKILKLAADYLLHKIST